MARTRRASIRSLQPFHTIRTRTSRQCRGQRWEPKARDGHRIFAADVGASFGGTTRKVRSLSAALPRDHTIWQCFALILGSACISAPRLTPYAAAAEGRNM